jgi:hypothetical protein
LAVVVRRLVYAVRRKASGRGWCKLTADVEKPEIASFLYMRDCLI